jgi:hypothetical protein
MEDPPVTIEAVAKSERKKSEPGASPAGAVVDQKVVAELVARAGAEGLSIGGEGGLLAQLTKLVLEASLEGELDARIDYVLEVVRHGRRGSRALRRVGSARPGQAIVRMTNACGQQVIRTC